MTIPTGPAFSARLGTALSALGVPDHPGTPTGAWLLRLEDSARQVTHGLAEEDLRRTAEYACMLCAGGAQDPEQQEEFALACASLETAAGLGDLETLEYVTIALATALELAHENPDGYSAEFTSPEVAAALSPLRVTLALSQVMVRSLRLTSRAGGSVPA